jgi:TPR repeat protein
LRTLPLNPPARVTECSFSQRYLFATNKPLSIAEYARIAINLLASTKQPLASAQVKPTLAWAWAWAWAKNGARIFQAHRLQRVHQVMKLFHAALLAFRLLPSAAIAGFEDGAAAHNKKDYAAALRRFKPLTAQGNATAQHKLGDMYEQGQGMPQSRVIAFGQHNLSAADDPSSDHKATATRTDLAKSMPPGRSKRPWPSRAR